MAVNERVQKEKHDFYHVDKAHSRKLSGTGLGLSIVKHTCRNYGIKIDAKSKEGVDSDFILTFPKESYHLSLRIFVIYNPYPGLSAANGMRLNVVFLESNH